MEYFQGVMHVRRHTGTSEETLQVPELEKKHQRKILESNPGQSTFPAWGIPPCCGGANGSWQ